MQRGCDFKIPVSFAFLCTAEDEVTAIYPSPAGPVSSRVDHESWAELVARYPLLLTLQPYVEGLIVHRVGGARDYVIAPIDECYALVGIVRREWHGFTGSEALTALKERIRQLQERAA